MNAIYSPLPQSPVRVRYEDGDIALDYATPLARAEAIAAYNRAYARCITVRVGLGDRVDEAMLVWAHLAAHVIVERDGESPFVTSAPEEPTPAYVRLDGTRLEGAVITTAPSGKCSRCDGTGVTTFVWVADGVCFRCNGSGVEPVSYHADQPTHTCVGPEWFPEENHWEPCAEHGIDCPRTGRDWHADALAEERELRSTDDRDINP